MLCSTAVSVCTDVIVTVPCSTLATMPCSTAVSIAACTDVYSYIEGFTLNAEVRTPAPIVTMTHAVDLTATVWRCLHCWMHTELSLKPGFRRL